MSGKDPYDVIIVGAGIAGLHAALRISEKNPKLTIAITEAYDYVGGRIFTFHHPKYKILQWESGAGRIHESHTLLKKYIKRYNLTTIPISSKQQWISQYTKIPEPDIWTELSEILMDFIASSNPSVLGTHTIHDILRLTKGKTYADKILAHFPYSAEVNTLRADLAIQSFRNEMGSSENFFVIKEGFDAVPTAMREELESRGVQFFFNHRLLRVSKHGLGQTMCTFQDSTLIANKVILALHSEALRQIHPFTNLPMLKHLAMQPLLRTYGIFQTPAWFSHIPRTVTNSPIRHMIPINPNQGTIMTSYTDGKDTEKWTSILKKKGEAGLQQEIMQALRDLFKNSHIPDPIFFKSHLWKDGCTYWLPGRYDPQASSEKFMNPLPTSLNNVYVCGESYSMRQAWVEGALEHTEAMLKKFFL